jgi:outer membrane protein TolC
MTEKKPVPTDQPAISIPESLFQTDPEVPPTTVRLSLFDTIGYSLEGNQDVLVLSYVPKQAKEDLVEAESAYDPSLFTDGSYQRNPNLESSVTNVVTEDEGLLQSGIRQPLKTGGSLSTFLEMGYSDLNNAEFQRTYRYTFAPTVELKQPLLKNLGSKKEQAAIKIASHRFNISEEEFRQNVIEIVTRVSRSYWQLLLFRELVEISQQNFDMAQEVYRREAIRLAERISKPLDVQRARSNVQARFGILLKSKERYRVVMDQLKLLVNWSNLTIDSKVEIIPIEKPQVVPVDVDERATIETALRHRPEIEKAMQALEIRRVEEDLSWHERLPQLDVFARYSVSGYGREFSSAVEDTGVNDEDAWAVGLNFEYPLGNRSAVARYRKKSLERQQAIAELERFKNQIELDVRQVLLAIDLAKGEIESTRLAQEAAEKVVEGEFARYDLGQVSNEELLRAQDLLAVTSRNHIRAIINYNVAMAELARAQGLLLPGLSIESENVETLFMESKPFVRK